MTFELYVMHEFSTAVSIVEAVKRAATSYNATRVLSIHLQIGQLSMLNHEQLLFGIEIASKATIAEGASVTIESLPTRISCKSCGAKTELHEKKTIYDLLATLECPKCSSKEVEIIQGRECVVKDIQAVVDGE
jgi:hydrogenase nickel incorporation protein HypA/HybF